MKFLSKKEYADDFQQGRLYMNSLSYFWNHGFSAQKDIMEGVLLSVPPETFSFPLDFVRGQLTDLLFQAVGYGFCNVFCMSAVGLSVLRDTFRGALVKVETPSNMHEFGKYAVIVTDTSEFLRRINRAAKGCKYLCGKVNYSPATLRGQRMDHRHHIIFKSESTFDISEIGGIKKRWDSFDKNEKYSGQMEWRLCIYRGEKSTSPFCLDIGDISDITRRVETKALREEIDRLLPELKISGMEDIFYGNVSRRELRELFYRLGDNRAWMLSTFG